MKCKIILKPGGGGFLGGVIIRSLLRWDGSKTARKFGDDGHPRKRAPRKKKTSKENIQRKHLPRKNLQRKDRKENLLKRKKSSKKRTPRKRTLRQHSPSTSSPIPPPNTSHMDRGPSMSPNLSPISSPRNSIVEAPVVDWSGQNTSNHFEMGDSQPRVDERFITMQKNEVAFQSIHDFQSPEKSC